MKAMILAAIAALSLGIGAANAQPEIKGSPHSSGDQLNFMRGGGG